ncbi:MAG TPA: hypothetical protein ENI05_14865 [Porticoccus sp.]|nr:hypothetical protein [Porticoccus sp.]
MLLPTLIFLSFAFWTLFHWQELPELLKNESEDDKWPLSIHHTATPIRLVLVTTIYMAFSYSLLFVLNSLLKLEISPSYSPWLAIVILICAHFTPYMSGLCSFIRYFFQRHLFFPSLPSHQEDYIISTLMTKAHHSTGLCNEIKHVHTLIKQEFNSGLHVFNLVALKQEKQLVRYEFKKIRNKGLLEKTVLIESDRQQLEFHLYSCYRLLTRITLARFWSGRDRRRSFRDMGYVVSATDGDIYAKSRRAKYILIHMFSHKKNINRKNAPLKNPKR